MKDLTKGKELATVRNIILSKKNYFLNLSYLFKTIDGELTKVRTIRDKTFVVSTSEKQAKDIKKAVSNGLFNIVETSKTVSGFTGIMEIFTTKKNIFSFDLLLVDGVHKVNVEHSKGKAKNKDKASFDARSVR